MILVYATQIVIITPIKIGCFVALVLWRINLCGLFNAKFCRYVYTYVTPVKSWPESNGNEWVYRTLKTYPNGSFLSTAV